jgi:hypothetical protein
MKLNEKGLEALNSEEFKSFDISIEPKKKEKVKKEKKKMTESGPLNIILGIAGLIGLIINVIGELWDILKWALRLILLHDVIKFGRKEEEE